MAAPSVLNRRQLSWSERGSAAVDHGDLEAARSCFAQAVREDRRSAPHRYHLAIVEEALGNLDAAAAGLTAALRLDPGMAAAARRLSLLAGRHQPEEAGLLDARGLQAALAHDTVDREAVAELALRHLEAGEPLRAALAKGRSEGWPAAAGALCGERTAPLLKDELLLAVLCSGGFRHPDLERLLTALRRALLLDLPQRRFDDRSLLDFALALAEQCGLNEHVWAASEEEESELARLRFSPPELLDGSLAAGRQLLLAALYRPLRTLLGGCVAPREARGIRPRALRDLVVRHLAEAVDEWARVARIPRLGSIGEATALAVAQQYEASPYPRWTSVGLLPPAQMRRGLARYFAAHELAFLDRPFEVLIAGCGTGQQAVQAALAYGPKARVLAIDLSMTSLTYAARMAERFGATNIAFAQADLQTLPELGTQFTGRFDVIECTGVLHHLADPFRGWRALMAGLTRDGRMFLGLYSAIARRDLEALRADPAYPGPGCSDAALRRFRKVLLDRPQGEPGAGLRTSRDFNATSNFRDLALHVNEHPVTLQEIERFLQENGLVFRGFQHATGLIEQFQRQYPDAGWPGDLACWAEFEQSAPYAFNGMYNFWCARG